MVTNLRSVKEISRWLRELVPGLQLVCSALMRVQSKMFSRENEWGINMRTNCLHPIEPLSIYRQSSRHSVRVNSDV